MAKSLRASAKVKARNARRYTPGNDYTVTHAARLNAVSQRLAVRMKAQSPKRSGKADEGSATSSGDNDDENGVDNDIDADATDNKDVAPTTMDSEGTNADVSDATATKKVGTHGTRESRRETWRKARGWKPKVGSKNGGRTKRRR